MFVDRIAGIKAQIEGDLAGMGIGKCPNHNEVLRAMRYVLSESPLAGPLRALGVRLPSRLGRSYFENEDFCTCVMAAYYMSVLRPLLLKQAYNVPVLELIKNNHMEDLNSLVSGFFGVIGALRSAVQVSMGRTTLQDMTRIHINTAWINDVAGLSAGAIVSSGKALDLDPAVVFLALAKTGNLWSDDSVSFTAPNLELIIAGLLNIYEYREVLSSLKRRQILAGSDSIELEGCRDAELVFSIIGKSHSELHVEAQRLQDNWNRTLTKINNCELI